MKNWNWLAVFAVVYLVISLLSLGGCASNHEIDEPSVEADNEAISYFYEMKAWHDSWDDLYQKKRVDPGDPNCKAQYDELIRELVNIEYPPPMTIEHTEYLHAHISYLEAERYMYEAQQREEERHAAMGSNILPDCFFTEDVSPEYHEACRMRYSAFFNLFLVRTEWEDKCFVLLEESFQTPGSALSRYQHPKYGYTIEYPEDWELYEDSPERVFISTEYGSVFAFITIQVSVALPIEQQAEFFVHYLSDVTTEEWKDFEVTYSHSLPGKWDWVIGFTYIDVFDEVEGFGEAYIIQTSSYSFVVQWDSVESQIETCKRIVDSFTVRI